MSEACTYQRGTWECRGDGFLWDADRDGWSPEETDNPCPACNTAEYLRRKAEDAETTSEWGCQGLSGTGADIWTGAVETALEANASAANEALLAIGAVRAALPDDQSQTFVYATDGSAA